MEPAPVKFKVKGEIADVSFDQTEYQYTFLINVLHPKAPQFMFMLYVRTAARDKKNPNNRRKTIARDLRDRHRACWQRMHDWCESANCKVPEVIYS
jgi:hypothetical protein